LVEVIGKVVCTPLITLELGKEAKLKGRMQLRPIERRRRLAMGGHTLCLPLHEK
jgi:hypothetical protein